jgi:hypothetical protein
MAEKLERQRSYEREQVKSRPVLQVATRKGIVYIRSPKVVSK